MKGPREKRRRTKLDGSSAANSCASFVRQEDDGPAGLTNAETVGLITTQCTLDGSHCSGRAAAMAGPTATAVRGGNAKKIS